jgi:anti-sigma factor RsiW
MSGNITENDLILYCYNELDQSRKQEIEQHLADDANLKHQYLSLRQTMQMLDSAKMNPSQTSVDIVREHSSQHSSLETS